MFHRTYIFYQHINKKKAAYNKNQYNKPTWNSTKKNPSSFMKYNCISRVNTLYFPPNIVIMIIIIIICFHRKKNSSIHNLNTDFHRNNTHIHTHEIKTNMQIKSFLFFMQLVIWWMENVVVGFLENREKKENCIYLMDPLV